MKTLSILTSLLFLSLAQISSADVVLRGECGQTQENLQNLELILDQFKPGVKLLDESKEFISRETGLDLSARKSMTNGLKIQIIKKVASVQQTLDANCSKKVRLSTGI